MDLKESLSFYRKEQGLSQVELAEALDISRQTISKWETGAALPSAENLLALSRLYGVTVDALLNGVETEALAEPVPARMFIGPVLCDEIIIFFHMLCVVTFQLGRLWFSRKKKGRVLQSQTAQQA